MLNGPKLNRDFLSTVATHSTLELMPQIHPPNHSSTQALRTHTQFNTDSVGNLTEGRR